MNIPETRRLMTGEEISNYVNGRFFRCISPFYTWLKKGESYWFEYHGDNTYEVRSDNALGKKVEMEVHQLLTCFVPTECETDIYFGIKYWHWLGEMGIHHGNIDEIVKWYEEKDKKNERWAKDETI